MNFECPICNELGDADGSLETNALVMVENCGHVFHKKCMIRWQNGGRSTCPACRQHCRKLWTLYGATKIMEATTPAQPEEDEDKDYDYVHALLISLREDYNRIKLELKEKARKCSLLELQIVQLKCELQLLQLRIEWPSSYKKSKDKKMLAT